MIVVVTFGGDGGGEQGDHEGEVVKIVVLVMLMVLVMLIETFGRVMMVAEVVMLLEMELGQYPGCRCDLSHDILQQGVTRSVRHSDAMCVLVTDVKLTNFGRICCLSGWKRGDK